MCSGRSFRITVTTAIGRSWRPYWRSPGCDSTARFRTTTSRASFAAIDVLVVPSIWPEVTGLVVLEAFLAGVPVVASRIGGLTEAVRDGVDGLLFCAGDAADLGRALRRLVEEPSLLHRLREARPVARTSADNAADLRSMAIEVVAAAPVRPSIAPKTGDASIAAIVINYGAPDETLIAVRALAASRRTIDHIVVVDNDSARPCVDRLHDLPVTVTYRPSRRNLGFSGGVNIGIAEARRLGATHVLLVNSDAVVPPDCVGTLERTLASSAPAGIAGPLMLSRSAPDQVASFGIRYGSGIGEDASPRVRPAGRRPQRPRHSRRRRRQRRGDVDLDGHARSRRPFRRVVFLQLRGDRVLSARPPFRDHDDRHS